MARELNRMEADVTKTQLPGGLSNVPVNLHPPSTQAQVLENHAWKSMESQDAQDTINHIQEMLEQLNSRGIQSLLVTVGPFGEIGLHGSQKGQLFLKDNADVGDRFAKMCTDLVEISGSDRQEHYEDDADDLLESDGNKLNNVIHDHKSKDTSLEEDNKEVNTFKASSLHPEGITHSGQSLADNDNSNELETFSMEVTYDLGTDKFDSNINVDSDSVTAKNEPANSKGKGESKNDSFDTPVKKKQKVIHLTEIGEKLSEGVVYTAKRVFSCKRCHERFPTTAAHNKHLRSRICFIRESYNKPKGSIKCLQCSCSFIRQDYLDVHEVIHEETAPHNFNVQFVDLSSKIDKAEEIGNDGDFCCQICGNSFLNKRLLLHHLIITHGRQYECKICGDISDSKNRCRLHMRCHENQSAGNSSEGNLFYCKLCKKVFRSRANLDRHDLTTHTHGEVRSFPCDKCKKIFSSQHFLDKHKDTLHLKHFVCNHDGCSRGFSTQLRLESHMLMHEERSFMCNVCGKMFSIKSNFQCHMNIHDTERKFGCDVCKKLFKTKDVLSKHKRIHSKTRQFCCEICGWGFNQSGSLKKHMDSHNNIKRYECDVCKKKFTNKASLQNHKLQNNHFSAEEQANENVTNSKKCEYCDKLFPPGYMYMYKRHVVIHTGVKPYSCDICTKSFSDKSNLKYHKLIHSDTKPFSCSTCGRGFVQKRGLRKHLESSQSCRVSVSKYNEKDNIEGVSDSFFQRSAELSGTNEPPINVMVGTSVQHDSQGRQVDIPFQETYSVEHYEAAVAKQDSVIPRHLITLSGDINSDGQSWVPLKNWK